MGQKDLIDSKVVPIGEYTFNEVLKSKIYFFPETKKKNGDTKYIFFYRVKPIQAITHYGVIEKYIKNANKMINIIEKMKSFKNPSKQASAYKFSKIEELKIKIPFDKNGSSVQGRINGNFNKIVKLRTTKGLFKRK